jgi:hypothetical protein
MECLSLRNKLTFVTLFIPMSTRVSSSLRTERILLYFIQVSEFFSVLSINILVALLVMFFSLQDGVYSMLSDVKDKTFVDMFLFSKCTFSIINPFNFIELVCILRVHWWCWFDASKAKREPIYSWCWFCFGHEKSVKEKTKKKHNKQTHREIRSPKLFCLLLQQCLSLFSPGLSCLSFER